MVVMVGRYSQRDESQDFYIKLPVNMLNLSNNRLEIYTITSGLDLRIYVCSSWLFEGKGKEVEVLFIGKLSRVSTSALDRRLA